MRVSSALTKGFVSAAALCLMTLPALGAGSVQGVVRGPAGPLAGAVVTVAETGQTSRTNPLGRYYLIDVPTGRATVVATEPGCFSALAAVQVREDGITERAFSLKPDASQPVKKPAPLPPVVSPIYWQPPAVTQSGSVEDGWQITARSDKPTYLPGDPIVVTVSLKNVSKQDQSLAETGGDSDFGFVVLHRGVETSATRYGLESHQRWVDLQQRRHSAGGGGPGFLLDVVHPGQEKVYQFTVNRFQDMTLDGLYLIVVNRETDTSTQLSADPVQVEVRTPAASAP